MTLEEVFFEELKFVISESTFKSKITVFYILLGIAYEKIKDNYFFSRQKASKIHELDDFIKSIILTS